MRYFLTLAAILFSYCSFAQQMSYQQWKEEAKTEIRLLPEYGNVQKTPGQIEADQELIKAELAQNGTNRKASEALINVGFNYLYRGDIKTAMYRFNQAWLLDGKNPNVYWGFGAVYFTFNDTEEAFKQYEKGLTIDPNCSNILTDEATIYMMMSAKDSNAGQLKKAMELFNKSYTIDPLNQNTLFKLSAAYFYKQDCKNAWRFYNECMKLGGKPITQEYTDALKKMCAN